jgi:hypothetical protein
MAIQFVGSTSGTGTAGYSVSLSGTLTGGIASSPATGDIVIVVTAFGNTAAVAPTITGNVSGVYTYFNAAVHVNDTWDTEFVAGYAVMGGSVDTSLTITRTSNAAYGGGTVVFVYRGQDPTTPIYSSTAYTTKTNGAYPNITNVSVTTIGDVVLAMGAGMQTTAGSAFTVPAQLTGNSLSVHRDGTTSDIGVWMADLTSTATGSQAISAPSGGTSTTSSSGAAHSIAIAQFVATNYTLDGLDGVYALTGGDAALTKTSPTVDYPLTANAGSYSLTGGTASLKVDRSLTATAGSYSVAGGSASLTASRSLSATGGSYAITGGDATLTMSSGPVAYTLDANGGAYSLTGVSASLKADRALSGSAGTYALTGGSAVLTKAVAPVNYTLDASAGTYSLTGESAAITVARVLEAGAGAYSLTGESADMVKVGFTYYTLDALAGDYALTGSTATLAWSGESSSFSQEVVLNKRWYVRRGKKLHIFSDPDDADDFIEAEARAEELVKQKTSRLARKKVRERAIVVKPEKTIEFTWLAQLVSLYSIPVNLPELIAQQDYERVMQIVAKAEQMQEEDDIEMLLLA